MQAMSTGVLSPLCGASGHAERGVNAAHFRVEVTLEEYGYGQSLIVLPIDLLHISPVTPFHRT